MQRPPRPVASAGPLPRILDAVALQDHLRLSFGLGASSLRVRTAASAVGGRALHTLILHTSKGARLRPASAVAAPTAGRVFATLSDADALLARIGEGRECDSCGAAAPAAATMCGACSRTLPAPHRERRAAPSLAQQRGLMPAAPTALSDSSWQAIDARAAARNEGACSICLQAFGMREQVLTSCSHVFHRVCLDSLERFMGSRTCPVCRTEGFQRLRTRQGARAHVLACVLRIQALRRGLDTRRRYFALRRQLYLAGGPGQVDPNRKRAFMLQVLGGLHRSLATDAANRRDAVDALCSETDAAIAASRAVLQRASMRMPRVADGCARPAPAATTAAPPPLGRGAMAGLLDELAVRLLAAEARQEMLASTRTALADARRAQTAAALAAERDARRCTAPAPLNREQWGAVHVAACARGCTTGDCAVCIMPLHGEEAAALLSCGHVLHSSCIDSLERFTARTAPAVAACPLCRSPYTRTDLAALVMKARGHPGRGCCNTHTLSVQSL
jgi:hypothetical protein